MLSIPILTRKGPKSITLMCQQAGCHSSNPRLDSWGPPWENIELFWGWAARWLIQATVFDLPGGRAEWILTRGNGMVDLGSGESGMTEARL